MVTDLVADAGMAHAYAAKPVIGDVNILDPAVDPQVDCKRAHTVDIAI